MVDKVGPQGCLWADSTSVIQTLWQTHCSQRFKDPEQAGVYSILETSELLMHLPVVIRSQHLGLDPLDQPQLHATLFMGPIDLHR